MLYSKLNKSPELEKQVVAFITVPANQSGVSKKLVERINNPDFNSPVEGRFLTHGLYDAEHDSMLNRAMMAGLANHVNDKVKLIFVPSYLNGRDGIFNFQLL
jgi:glycogen phosphorylase/synthase